MSQEAEPTNPEGATTPEKEPTDIDELMFLISQHGQPWVLEVMDSSEMAEELERRSVHWVYGNAHAALQTLEEMGYPREVIALLREYQQCPWLCPTPGREPSPAR